MGIEVDIRTAKKILRKLMDDDGLTLKQAEREAVRAFCQNITFHTAKQVLEQEGWPLV